MRNKLFKLRPPLRLSLFSNIVAVFFHKSNLSCGAIAYGFPMNFIRSSSHCTKHSFPIDFTGLFVDLMYHFIIWSILIYLWKDAIETWQMIKGELRTN